jgi:hypothetical protein
MDMVAEVAIEELEKIFPGYKFDKKNLTVKRPDGKTYEMARVKEYMNFIISIEKAEKPKRTSRSKSCPV